MQEATNEQLLTAKDVSVLLNVSKRQVFRLKNAGKICMPLQIGGSARWRKTEVMGWLDAGCPDHSEWQMRKCGSNHNDDAGVGC